MWSQPRHPVLKFLLVGACNTAFSYGIYAIGIAMGLAYFMAYLVAVVCGIAVGFQAQKRLVFQTRTRHAFYRFVAVWVVLYLFNTGVIGLLIRIGCSPYTAGAFALVPTTALSYLLQRYVVFRRPSQEG